MPVDGIGHIVLGQVVCTLSAVAKLYDFLYIQVTFTQC